MKKTLLLTLCLILALSMSVNADKAATVDETRATQSEHSIGNKGDTAVTTSGTTASLMAYVKGLVANGAATLGGINATTTDSVHGKIGTDTEMADSSLYDMLGSTTAATTDSINGKIGTDTEMADSSLYDMLGGKDGATTDSINGKIGTDTEMADSSLYDMLGAADGATTDSINGKIGTDTQMADFSLWDLLVPVEATGETDIDVSESDYTGYITLLTITAAAGQCLMDVVVDLDLNKTTTGWDAVSTAADTIDIAAASKVDGTNFRNIANATQITANGDESLEMSENGVRLNIGMIGPGGDLAIYVKLSVERADAEIPYRVLYRGGTPTITPVAAG